MNWQSIIMLVAAAASFLVALVNGVAAYYRDKQTQQELWAQERRFEQFKKDLEDRQRRLVRFENVQELMKQYKKPLLQSAFDLQSRIANQVKQNFLHVFINQRNSARDKDYARYNFAFVIAEFMGWLEVIRQEIVFISGQEDSVLLSSLIDAIKFQFTGETPVQGVPPKGCEADPEYDKNSTLLQLYAGELRAIGEVMIKDRGADSMLYISAGAQNLQVIGYAEFMRRMTKEGPPDGSDPELIDQWECVEKFMQESLAPLLSHIDRMAELAKGDAPVRRLAMMQVLLCRLIDMLDNAVPWDVGRKYDLEAGEEPQFIPRDFRITPLVAHLNGKQRKWLSTQPFMESTDWYVDDPAGEWEERMCGGDVEPEYRKLCFCGFREDLATKTQAEREKGPDMWPGCFPPRLPRQRPLHWYWENGLPPPPWMMGGAPEATGLAKLFKWGSSKVAPSGPSSAGLRQRKNNKEGENSDHNKEADAVSIVVGGRTHSIAVNRALSMAPMLRTGSVTGNSMAGHLPALPPPPPPMVVTTTLARADTLKSRDRAPSMSGSPHSSRGASEDGVPGEVSLSSKGAGSTRGSGNRPQSPADKVMADASEEAAAVADAAGAAQQAPLPNTPAPAAKPAS